MLSIIQSGYSGIPGEVIPAKLTRWPSFSWQILLAPIQVV